MTGDAEHDRGSASLTIVLVAPLVLLLMFAGFQAAMWNHARTEARVVARETAVLVARDHVSPLQAVTAAMASLATDSLLSRVDVRVETTTLAISVTITGDAPGMLRGTSSAVSVTVAVARDGWVSL